jgi:hypothetical protein
VPLWFWPILLFTGVFGVSAAIFIFRQQPVAVQPVGPPTASASDTKPAPDVPPPTTSGEAPPATSVASTTPTSTGKVASGGPKGSSGSSGPKQGIDLGGLGLGAGPGGPNVGPGNGPSAGGGGLDQSSIERVVASHRTGVKRTCWERGGADQKSSVNVTVSVTVAPNGSVAGTSSSGDDPVVAKCIESQVRGWMFNAPGATTRVDIPFKFVRQ